jgi:hypothetical protein
LLLERAKCHLVLENYGYAIADINAALAIKPLPELYFTPQTLATTWE